MSAWIERGGPVMWPLLGLSFLTVTVLFERLFFWARELRRSPAAALAAARVRAGRGALHRDELERLLDLEERRLRRGLPWLDTAITAAPLLGILGTVLGIIDSFALLAAATPVDPLGISGGVAEALITTAAGLLLALLALFPYNLLRSLAGQRIARLEREWQPEVDRP
jgi:biopolymer transport protein ExbB